MSLRAVFVLVFVCVCCVCVVLSVCCVERGEPAFKVLVVEHLYGYTVCL